MSTLRDAAQALIDRWETPLWKDAPATGNYIYALRNALAATAVTQWPIRGVRVDGTAVIIEVKGGNEAARRLCGELVAGAQMAARQQWIPVSERLPKPGTNVLVVEGKSVLRAFHAPRFTLDTESWGEFEPDGGEYDEVTDANYFPEGWYESNRHEETHWALDSEPTHWMPLPAAPKEVV